MSENGTEPGEKAGEDLDYTRREALASIRKYSLVSGAAVVALTASGAVTEAAASTGNGNGNGNGNAGTGNNGNGVGGGGGNNGNGNGNGGSG